MKGFLRLVGMVALLGAAAYGLRAYFQGQGKVRGPGFARSPGPPVRPAGYETPTPPGKADAGEAGRGEGSPPLRPAAFRPDVSGQAASGPAASGGAEAVPVVRRESPTAAERAAGALARGRDIMRTASTPAQRVEAWGLLSLAYLQAADRAQRNEARDILRPFVEAYVLSPRMPDDPAIAAIHLVQEGDTLGKIAKRHGTTIEAIRRINGLKGDVIHVGRRLKILDKPIEILVDKSEFRMGVLYGGNFLLEFPVGLGKGNTTPAASFVIDYRAVQPPWHFQGEEILPHDPRYELGLRWLGFADSDAGTGLGIHGTDDETTVGCESSRGCIRLRNRDILLLYDLVPLGTKVRVFP